MMTLKIRSRSPNLIKPLNHPNVTIYEVWPESVKNGSRNRVQTSFFLSFFFCFNIQNFQSADVTF